jgi:hypothetical protein
MRFSLRKLKIKPTNQPTVFMIGFKILFPTQTSNFLMTMHRRRSIHDDCQLKTEVIYLI